MSRDVREVLADWLILFGAVGLLMALFLPWSHERGLPGFPNSPTAWQVYSVVDVLLALLVAALLAVALLGGRTARIVVLLGVAIALAFTVHALSIPPSNGAVPATSPASAAGEVVAIVGLAIAVCGLALSFTAD